MFYPALATIGRIEDGFTLALASDAWHRLFRSLTVDSTREKYGRSHWAATLHLNTGAGTQTLVNCLLLDVLSTSSVCIQSPAFAIYLLHAKVDLLSLVICVLLNVLVYFEHISRKWHKRWSQLVTGSSLLRWIQVFRLDCSNKFSNWFDIWRILWEQNSSLNYITIYLRTKRADQYLMSENSLISYKHSWARAVHHEYLKGFT